MARKIIRTTADFGNDLDSSLWREELNQNLVTTNNTLTNHEGRIIVLEAAPEAWHEVGSSGEPAFQNSWVNYYGGTTYDTAAFYKHNGIVYLKGLVRSGTLNTTIFTLPVGYRPDLRQMFVAIQGTNGSVRLEIRSDGTVLTSGATNNGYQSLWCSFRIE